MGATGSAMAYTVGGAAEGLDGDPVWELHEGTSTATGDAATVFVHKKTAPPGTAPAPGSATALAQNAVKRLKMLRHPNFLRILVRRGALRVPRGLLGAADSTRRTCL